MKKLAEKISRVGLIANTEKFSCRAAVQKAAALIVRSGRAVLTETATAEMARLRCAVCPDAATLARQTDLLVVFGGDGTMLRAAREIAGAPTPILGINVGGLGFLTAVSSQRLVPALARVWAGGFTLESRPLIKVTGPVRGHPLLQRALNDFVISRGAGSRLIEIEVSVDGQLLTRYRCDGLIISSPTGSTAYSLAAGGAIVSPEAEVFTLTPICPHTLSIRPLVVGLDSVVRVKLLSSRLVASLSGDGQQQTELGTGDTVVIRRSDRTIRLLRLSGTSFFSTLRQKFGWSGGNL